MQPLQPETRTRLEQQLAQLRNKPKKNAFKIQEIVNRLQDTSTDASSDISELLVPKEKPSLTKPSRNPLSLENFPQRPEAIDLPSQLAAIDEATQAALQMGILHPLQKLKPTGVPNGRVALIMPMVHPDRVAIEIDRKRQELVVPCQAELFRYLTIQRRFGVQTALQHEGFEGGKRNHFAVCIESNLGSMPAYSAQIQRMLFESPDALAQVLSGLKGKLHSSFCYILPDTTLWDKTSPDTEAVRRQYDIAHNHLATLHTSAEEFPRAYIKCMDLAQELWRMMNSDFVQAAEESDPLNMHRLVTGVWHTTAVANELRAKGWEVWLAIPRTIGHADIDFPSLENNQYYNYHKQRLQPQNSVL